MSVGTSVSERYTAPLGGHRLRNSWICPRPIHCPMLGWREAILSAIRLVRPSWKATGAITAAVVAVSSAGTAGGADSETAEAVAAGASASAAAAMDTAEVDGAEIGAVEASAEVVDPPAARAEALAAVRSAGVTGTRTVLVD